MRVSFSGVTEAVGRSARAFSACSDGGSSGAPKGRAGEGRISMHIRIKILVLPVSAGQARADTGSLPDP